MADGVLRITLGALGAERVLRMLTGGSLHKREFLVRGEGPVVRCNVASAPGSHLDGSEATVHLTLDTGGAHSVPWWGCTRSRSYPVLFAVDETVIRDQAGREIDRRGQAHT